VGPAQADPGQLTTIRAIGDLADDPVVRQGGLLVPDRTNNVYETIVVPAPQFFTAQYDFTFWTQYSEHMTQMIEALMASFLPQGNAWRLDTPKGYWFIATVESNTYNAELNVDDYSQEERVIRYKFVVKVPGYIMASSVPGAPVPIKRYVSSPSISFETGVVGAIEAGDCGSDDPFLGADDPTLPLEDRSNGRRDQRRRNDTRLYVQKDAVNPDDPALKQLKRGRNPAQFKKVTGYDQNGRLVTRYFRVTDVNRFTGETVLSPGPDMGGLTIVVIDD
jgi:hypothetical protein